MTRSLHYTPFLPEVMADPYPFYRRLRDEEPVYYISEYDGWAIARFEDVWQAARQPDVFVNARGTTAPQALSKIEQPVPSLNQIDDPDHTRLRSQLRRFFTRAPVARLEPAVRETVRAILDEGLERGELDAMRELAEPLAARIACRLLALPEEAGPLLTAWVNRYTANDPEDQGRSSDAMAATMEMNAYLAEFVRDWRARGRSEGEIVDVFLACEIGGRRLEDLEIASHLQTLVIGGTDTTPKVIGTALVELFRQPDQRKAVVDKPALAAAAFAEALRYEAPTHFMARTVAKPTRFAGHEMKPGQGVLLLFASANRDEREHPDPDRYDLHRDPRRNLGFGHGAHICIGAQVARLEGRVLLQELLARAPGYTIDESRIVYRRADQIHGTLSLPVGLR